MKNQPKPNTENQKNSWICENEKTVFSSPIMELIERKCFSSEDSRKFNFYLLRSKDWCNIIPITEDGKIVMVRQYRIGISAHTVEVPGGVCDSSDANTQVTALREMEEETGYTLLPGGKCIALGSTFPNPSILNNRCHSFVVGPVKKTNQQKLDPGEMIEVAEIPIAEIPTQILEGKISHALMLNTFFLLALQSKKTSEALVSELGQFTRCHSPT